MIRDIDEIIDQVKQRVPAMKVWQHRVKYPGVDDDGIWIFTVPGVDPISKSIQIESSGGTCPFLVEHDGMESSSEAETARSVEEAVAKVVSYLTAL